MRINMCVANILMMMTFLIGANVEAEKVRTPAVVNGNLLPHPHSTFVSLNISPLYPSIVPNYHQAQVHVKTFCSFIPAFVYFPGLPGILFCGGSVLLANASWAQDSWEN